MTKLAVSVRINQRHGEKAPRCAGSARLINSSFFLRIDISFVLLLSMLRLTSTQKHISEAEDNSFKRVSKLAVDDGTGISDVQSFPVIHTDVYRFVQAHLFFDSGECCANGRFFR
jgi:hypothetical protein